MADPTIQDFLGGLYSIYNLSGATFQDHNGTLFQVQDGLAIAGPSGSGGRLTLTTATPVMTAAATTGATAVLYTPFVGDRIAIYNGTSWRNFSFTELTNTLTASSVGSAGPAAVAVSSVYDLFVWDTSLGTVNAGTMALTRGPVWTSDTARSAGTGLVRQNGVWVNSVAITNGPAIKCGRYVGTIRTNSGGTLDWQFGGLAAGCTPGLFMVWNQANRIDVPTGTIGDTGDSWPNSGSVISAANASNTARFTFVVGQNEDVVTARYDAYGLCGVAGNALRAGVALDSITTFSGTFGQYLSNASTTTVRVQVTGGWSGYPGLGVHFVSAVEYCSSGTFFGDAGVPTVAQTGMFGMLRM